MAFGLSLAGGGARGAAHVGVLMALEENHMVPSCISGASAGSIFAGLYAMRLPIATMKELICYFSRHPRRLIDVDVLGLIKGLLCIPFKKDINLSGILKGNKLEEVLRQHTGSINIKNIKMPLLIPAVNLINGKTIAYVSKLRTGLAMEDVIWKSDADLADVIRASCSVPMVFQPKHIQDMCLVDGGVTDVLPVNLLMAYGEPNILAVDLADEYKKPNTCSLLEIGAHSLSIMQNKLKHYGSEGEKLLLSPALPEKSGLLTFDMMEECMEAGYEATIKMMPAIKSVFSPKKTFVF